MGLVAGTAFAGDAVAGKHLGTWLTDEGKGKVELRECGNDSLCSEVVWLKDPVDEKGRPWRDQLNPDPKLNGRPIMGLNCLIGVKKVAPRTWSGQIYDPEKGETYYLKYIKVGEQQVEIRGCLSAGWPCRTKYWTRTAPVRPVEPMREAKRPAPNPPAPARQASVMQTPQLPAVEPERPVAETPAPRKTVRERTPAPPQEAAPLPQAAPRPQQQETPRRPAVVARTPSVELPDRKPAPSAVLPWHRMAQRDDVPPRRSDVPPPPAFAPPPDATAALPRQRTAALPRPSAEGGVYHVQVTAGQDRDRALRSFGMLQNRYPELLGGFLPNVQMVDLGEKGVWYRVRVGPLGEHAAALSFCENLKAAGGDCLIRRD